MTSEVTVTARRQAHYHKIWATVDQPSRCQFYIHLITQLALPSCAPSLANCTQYLNRRPTGIISLLWLQSGGSASRCWKTGSSRSSGATCEQRLSIFYLQSRRHRKRRCAQRFDSRRVFLTLCVDWEVFTTVCDHHVNSLPTVGCGSCHSAASDVMHDATRCVLYFTPPLQPAPYLRFFGNYPAMDIITPVNCRSAMSQKLFSTVWCRNF